MEEQKYCKHQFFELETTWRVDLIASVVGLAQDFDKLKQFCDHQASCYFEDVSCGNILSAKDLGIPKSRVKTTNLYSLTPIHKTVIIIK